MRSDGGVTVDPGRAGWSGKGCSATYFGRADFHLGHFSTTATVGQLVVKLQILQALGQGQFLLDSHAKEGVQCLLFILCCCQLPLHVIQLRNILITPMDT